MSRDERGTARETRDAFRSTAQESAKRFLDQFGRSREPRRPVPTSPRRVWYRLPRRALRLRDSDANPSGQRARAELARREIVLTSDAVRELFTLARRGYSLSTLSRTLPILSDTHTFNKVRECVILAKLLILIRPVRIPNLSSSPETLPPTTLPAPVLPIPLSVESEQSGVLQTTGQFVKRKEQEIEQGRMPGNMDEMIVLLLPMMNWDKEGEGLSPRLLACELTSTVASLRAEVTRRGGGSFLLRASDRAMAGDGRTLFAPRKSADSFFEARDLSSSRSEMSLPTFVGYSKHFDPN